MEGGALTLAICSVGLTLGLFFANGLLRTGVLMGVAATLFATAAGTIYLFTWVHWWLPLPQCIQYFSLPFVMVGAIAGYSAFLTSVFGGAFANRVRARRLLAAGCLLVIPASLVNCVQVAPYRSYREQLAYFTLWDDRIPTHNEAS